MNEINIAFRAGFKKESEEDGKPDKVEEIADSIREENPTYSDEKAYRIAWETYKDEYDPDRERTEGDEDENNVVDRRG